MNRTNKNKCDVHFFTDFDEYEYIQRFVFNSDIPMAEACRNKWFSIGWRNHLERLRKQHKKQGLEDQRFWHKKQIEQEGKK
jgi:hypothetical protein